MLTRKHLVLGFLVFCLTATLLVGVTSSAEYDPWCDIDDNGLIDIVDIVNLAIRFGEEGTPINKTALLLELQSMVGYLNEALETRVPKIGYISVPAAAFEVQYSPYVFSVGTTLTHHENFTVRFYGSVQLPHGANVTTFTFYWIDAEVEDFVLRLWRYNQTHNQKMAEIWSSGNAGYGSSSTDSISLATVDNSRYAYYLEIEIPREIEDGHGGYQFQYAVLEYEHLV